MTCYDNLVIYRKQLGDVLLLQPALATLASRGTVALATNPAFSDLVTLMPGPVYMAPQWLPKARQIYCLETRASAMAYAAQGLGARRTLILTRDKAPWWRSLIFGEMHVAPGNNTYRARLFHGALGGQPEDFSPPSLTPPPLNWQIETVPAIYGVIHPTSAWQRKTWAPERWIEALRGIDTSLRWVVSSGTTPWEVKLAGAVAAGLGEQAINLAGKTSLRQYIALLSGACVTLCVDGSSSHISAAFGKPTLTLFGPTNPTHWHFETPKTPRLWAADFAGERKPPVDAIPVIAVRNEVHRLLEMAND